MKDTYYFPHDYHARHDPKLEKLRMEVGPVGDGIFWDLVEMLYEENGYLPLNDIPIYAKMLNTNEQMLNKVINDVFLKDENVFYNQSLLDRLEHIRNVREERRAAGELSGKARQRNKSGTNVEQLGNNIKESKVKESKEDKVKDINPPISSISIKTEAEKVAEFHIYDKFEEFWQAYPKRVGYSLATLIFRATIKNEEDFKLLMAALKNYLASKEVKDGYVKNGSNWIEDWRGWLKTEKPKRVVKPEALQKPMSKEDREKLHKLLQETAKKL